MALPGVTRTAYTNAVFAKIGLEYVCVVQSGIAANTSVCNQKKFLQLCSHKHTHTSLLPPLPSPLAVSVWACNYKLIIAKRYIYTCTLPLSSPPPPSPPPLPSLPPLPQTQPSHAPRYPTSLWGPTCDGLDKICDTVLAELSLGDWIYFDNMGAYTVSAASTFNGFLRPKAYYYTSEKNRWVGFAALATNCFLVMI